MRLSLFALAVGLGGIVTLVDDQVLWTVVVLTGQVAGEDGLGALGVALLGVERGTGHVGNHGVAAAEGVLGSAQDVVAGSGLGEPDIATVAGKVAGLESLSDVLLDDDGATGGVDEVRAWRFKSVYVPGGDRLRNLPFFILLISSLLNRPRVFSCRGQLMVTTSH